MNMAVIERLYREKSLKGYYNTPRVDALRALPGPVGVALEIGCGAGSTLRYLKQAGLADKTVGIDTNRTQLELARQQGVDRVVACNVEETELPFQKESFDLILCLDVLEHLVDPWTTMRRLEGFLRPNGKIIASIPNVQNLRVIGPLLMGRWEYREAGLLDATHLRFFTKSTIIKLFSGAGLHVEQVLHNVDPHPIPRIMNIVTAGIFRRFVTLQFIVRAGRRVNK